MRRLVCFGILVMLIAAFITGCKNPETLVNANVVINGKTVLENAAYLRGAKGFSVDANRVVLALHGSVEVVNEGTVVVTLNGKRILVCFGDANVSYDVQVRRPVSWTGRTLQFEMLDLNEILPLAFPSARSYRDGDKVYIQTSD